ncbi:MAG: hypothetical protein AAF413_00830 [Patescibacteria group bacterium]
MRMKQSDSTFLLKIVLYFLLGALWLHVEVDGQDWFAPIPVGFLIGLLFVSHDHFAIDRKIEYAILVVSMFVSFVLPIGLVLQL